MENRLIYKNLIQLILLSGLFADPTFINFVQLHAQFWVGAERTANKTVGALEL